MRASRSMPARPEAVPAPAVPSPAVPVAWTQPYAPARGFTWRREPFGGILYHYEGVQPDPRVTFVEQGFCIDLLDALLANAGVPLGELIAGVQAHCGLDPAQRTQVEAFFATLIQRGALVPV